MYPICALRNAPERVAACAGRRGKVQQSTRPFLMSGTAQGHHQPWGVRGVLCSGEALLVPLALKKTRAVDADDVTGLGLCAQFDQLQLVSSN